MSYSLLQPEENEGVQKRSDCWRAANESYPVRRVTQAAPSVLVTAGAVIILTKLNLIISMFEIHFWQLM